MRTTQNNVDIQLFNRQLIQGIIQKCNRLANSATNDQERQYCQYVGGNTFPVECIAYLESPEASLATSTKEVIQGLYGCIATDKQEEVTFRMNFMSAIKIIATTAEAGQAQMLKSDNIKDKTLAADVLTAMNQKHSIGLISYGMEKLFPQVDEAISANNMTVYGFFQKAVGLLQKFLQDRATILATPGDKKEKDKEIQELREILSKALEPLGTAGECLDDNKIIDSKGIEIDAKSMNILQAIVSYSKYIEYYKYREAMQLKRGVLSTQQTRSSTPISTTASSSSSLSASTTTAPSSTQPVMAPPPKPSTPAPSAPPRPVTKSPSTVFQPSPSPSITAASPQTPMATLQLSGKSKTELKHLRQQLFNKLLTSSIELRELKDELITLESKKDNSQQTQGKIVNLVGQIDAMDSQSKTDRKQLDAINAEIKRIDTEDEKKQIKGPFQPSS